ncbi:MAG: SAM-dependent methyltransferase, partial [Chloroflexota bacterium]
AAEQVIKLVPDVPLVARANRAFLRRAVNFLLAEGVTQFLDLGSGIPTVGNVHEVAQEAHPGARIVYVDIDPVAVTHSAALLKDNPTATVIQADARKPETILGHPEVQRLLDFRQPMAVLMLAFLHFVTDDEEAETLVRGMRDALAPGGYIAISHALSDAATRLNVSREMVEKGTEMYRRTTNPVRLRSRAQIERYFEGLQLVEPGLVDIPLWRPEGPDDIFFDTPARASVLAGVGRKP